MDCQSSEKYLMGILAQEVLTEDTARLSSHLAVPKNIQRKSNIELLTLRGEEDRKKKYLLKFSHNKPRK